MDDCIFYQETHALDNQALLGAAPDKLLTRCEKWKLSTNTQKQL